MLRGSALTARVKSGKRARGSKNSVKGTEKLKKKKTCPRGKTPLTCNVNVSWGGVQGRRRPGSTAVAGSDAFGSREMVVYFSIHQVR